jgi:hypothetical protein
VSEVYLRVEHPLSEQRRAELDRLSVVEGGREPPRLFQAAPAGSRLSAVRHPDDRLAAGALGGAERGGRFGERQHGSNDRAEPSIPEPPGQVREPDTIGFGDEEDRRPVLGPDLGWRGETDECDRRRGRKR